MKKRFDLEVIFENHRFNADGYIYNRQVKINHLYLQYTEIEILNSLTCDQYEDICDLILELCK